ncbi:MAG: hypothetical protein JXB26_17015 [Candidatus Aminicenantes bacterium]|nr:hypothetical protein [Candidatus Aminicenantes bacterium]
MNAKQKFLHGWLSHLTAAMDEHLEYGKKIALLEDCGRACAGTHVLETALRYKGNLEGWLIQMRKWVGADNVKKEGNTVSIVYEKCLCPLVQDLSPLKTKTFCHCSRGWLLENFSAVLDRPVEVDLEESIMMGGKQCRFVVYI